MALDDAGEHPPAGSKNGAVTFNHTLASMSGGIFETDPSFGPATSFPSSATVPSVISTGIPYTISIVMSEIEPINVLQDDLEERPGSVERQELVAMVGSELFLPLVLLQDSVRPERAIGEL